jgi:hypothetical protein
MMILPAIFLQSSLLIPVADTIPRVNYTQTCRIESQQTGATEQDREACDRDEEAALDQLKKDWSKYSAGDKGNCISSTTGGYLPSYVELVTCLEMYRFLKQPKSDTTKADAGATLPAPAPTGTSGRPHRRQRH